MTALPPNNNIPATIRYIEDKPVDMEIVEQHLQATAKANHWTNFGPLSLKLEKVLADQLELSDDLRVVTCCNATVALHALVAMQETLADKPLRWASPSFGFYSSADGILSEAQLVDCDSNAMLDLEQLDPELIDGLIVTNIFGQTTDLSQYQAFATKHNKLLIIDSAMAVHPGGHIANECISLHHTKPWGFGEGGCAIVHKDHETLFRDIISFGHSEPKAPINRLAINGKISDIACAFILMRMQQMQTLGPRYQQQYQRIASIGLDLGYTILAGVTDHPGIPASVPLLLPSPCDDYEHPDLPIRRYYHPLGETTVAWDIYNRIVNVPCHVDMECFSDSTIRQALHTILERC